jgi:hypothetical protein
MRGGLPVSDLHIHRALRRAARFASASSLALFALACSKDDTTADVADASSDGASRATIKLTSPHEGDSFVITPNDVDVPIDFTVEGFTLVPLGQEGTDPSKGQARFYVDEMDCNDPGEGGEPAVPYNRIYPNEADEKTIGMDYCAGGVRALDDKTHTLTAQLWHGEIKLNVADEIHFHTTFSSGIDAGTDAGADAGSDAGSDAAADAGSD